MWPSTHPLSLLFSHRQSPEKISYAWWPRTHLLLNGTGSADHVDNQSQMDYLIELGESDEELGKVSPSPFLASLIINLVSQHADAKLQKVERLTFVYEGPVFPLRDFTQVRFIHAQNSKHMPHANNGNSGTCSRFTPFPFHRCPRGRNTL